MALEGDTSLGPVNLASSEEVAIGDLAELIIKTTGVVKNIRPLIDKPEGHQRLTVSAAKAKEKLGWRAKTSLEQGIQNTIAWYERVSGTNKC